MTDPRPPLRRRSRRPRGRAGQSRSTYRVELKALGAYREEALVGALAAALVRSGHLDSPDRDDLIIAVWLPKWRPGARRTIERYLETYAPGTGWILLDANGRASWKLSGSVDEREGRRIEEPPRSPGRRSINPFTRLNQWVLKVLFFSKLEPRYWGGPRQVPRTVSELARVAGCSQPQASNLVGELERRGLLDRSGKGFSLADPRRLLELWAERAIPAGIPIKPLIPLSPDTPPSTWLANSLPEVKGPVGPEQPVVGGHLACGLLGLSNTTVPGALLYSTKPRDELLDAHGLTLADRSEPHLLLVERAHSEMILKGAVLARGLQVTDVVQCYLDLRHKAPRGQEQAEFLFERILLPYFRERQWR